MVIGDNGSETKGRQGGRERGRDGGDEREKERERSFVQPIYISDLFA